MTKSDEPPHEGAEIFSRFYILLTVYLVTDSC